MLRFRVHGRLLSTQEDRPAWIWHQVHAAAKRWKLSADTNKIKWSRLLHVNTLGGDTFCWNRLCTQLRSLAYKTGLLTLTFIESPHFFC